MLKSILIFSIIFAVFSGGFLVGKLVDLPKSGIVEKIEEIKPKLLEKYTLENLSNAVIPTGKIKVNEIFKDDEKFTSYLFEFEFSPDLSNKNKKITGQINIPLETSLQSEHKRLPVLLMLRGYVNQVTYITGDGTRNAAKFFAENGFITVAPDFLGYAGSDKESGNIFETRFQTYVTALTLLRTLEALSEHQELISENLYISQLLTTNNLQLFLWAHSNGGQIALTLLEISGVNYPTVLWAPVSKNFPYSVLYYTDESDDRGKLIRRELAEFERDYDADLYSFDLYLDKINAPIQIHQGTEDDAVPKVWSDQLVKNLEKLGKDVKYYIYPGADHNLRPSWDNVVEKDLEFFRSYLTN